MSSAHEDGPVPGRGVSRRCLLAAGAVGIPGMALAACSRAAGSGSAGSSGGAGKPLAKLSDINVGEAIAATGPDGGDIIIVRPTENTVTAFSAACTHAGCPVQPAGKQLDCPCHGSVFDLKGAVLNGPAQQPLRPVRVKLSGDDVLAG
jgi:cytochrome b6-f complex iron-sulfur subunit